MEDALERLKKSAWDDMQYFSNNNKEGRERWVVSEFLSIVAVEHDEDELISPEQRSKVDVQFRDAAFQIKELFEPNFRRNDMYKNDYNSICAAGSVGKISWDGEGYTTSPVTNMFELAHKESKKLACDDRYLKVKSELDLLIYVTRARASLIQQCELDESVFSSMGWRSVSCVNSKQAVVLYSSPAAPKFIRDMSQKLINKQKESEDDE